VYNAHPNFRPHFKDKIVCIILEILRYAPEKRLHGQLETPEIITNCTLTKVVSVLKNKDMLICLPFV